LIEWLTNHTGELWVAALSIVTVMVSLFRAEAAETEASAKALRELAEISQELRERVRQLEEHHQAKDAVIALLRRRANPIPTLKQRIRALQEEVAHLRQDNAELRGYCKQQLALKDEQMSQLHQQIERMGI
jgi:septal ring factor EnvC (AmiA/AmiB activator)